VSGSRGEPATAREAMARRRAARLAAVQGLYQLELAGGEPSAVVQEFLARALDNDTGGGASLDVAWFRKVLEGAWANRVRLDAELGSALAQGWTLSRCGAVVRAILRAGAFELAALPEVPTKVAINEYVEIAHLFSSGGEPGFVHAVLDRIASRFRAGRGEL
jgi:N utilization substance protein B